MGSGIDMRPIKFRAWDGERMIYDVQNIYDTIVRLKTADGEDVDQCDTKLPCVSAFGELLRCEYVPIMQFTGLNDKNGKEIYEGDITDEGVVEWSNDLTWEGGGSKHSGFYFAGERELDYHTSFDRCEVIGNIFENPELLE